MKNIFFLLSILILSLFSVYFWPETPKTIAPTVSVKTEPVISNGLVVTSAPTVVEKPDGYFETITLNSEYPGSELSKIVGFENVFTTLAINRIDDKSLWQGMTVVVPKSFDDPSLWEFMPAEITSARDIPKIVLISQRTQAFGFYENGKLVRSGPISSGKKLTPTPSKLYFTNWKGKEVVSTFSDEWILKWNFNIDNELGIGLHYYAMPGYPASHSCVRFYEADARWLYDWADQWTLASDGQTKLVNGTPVIIFGEYNFSRKAPWKNLPNNADATKVSKEEVEILVNKYLNNILE